MNREQAELFERIKTYRFDGTGTPGAFRERLAKENGWSPGRAERVIGEYRRFAFLAAAAGHPVSPPPAVDEAWHLHLIHTRAYWEEFCPKVLGKPLHHDPSSGGAGETKKFADWYARTVESYRRFFGGDPPADIWPRPVARRVTPPAPYKLWAKLRAPFAAAALAAVGALAVGCGASGSNADAPTAAGILCAAFGFCFLAFGLSAVVERCKRRGRRGHRRTFTQSASDSGSTWTFFGSDTHSGGNTACDGDSASASDGGSGSSCGSSCGASSCGGGGGCGGGD